MEIVKITEIGVDAAAAKAADIIAKGGIIVYPTDTLYGLGVNAVDAAAVKRLRELKGREKKKPVSILLSSIEELERHTDLPERAKKLAAKHFPGALTLVVPAKSHVPEDITLNGSIGVRIPADDFALALAAMSEFPVTATSANLAGLATPETVPEILIHFGPKIADIDLFIDAGPRKSEPASTVIGFIDGNPHILREGAVSKEDLGI
jgi:L-threonylcarbamoyladenylate synthase